MTAPAPRVVSATCGYHPLPTDLAEILKQNRFEDLLVFGPAVADVLDHVATGRIVIEPPVELPVGIYWFSNLPSPCVLYVVRGLPPVGSLTVEAQGLPVGSALDNALSWFEHAWDEAQSAQRPRFAVGEDVLVGNTGHDGVVKSRQYLDGRWLYAVFAAGQTLRHPETALESRPTVDDAAVWASGKPVSPRRFAATLSRAKLDGHFTDTVFSFRATRTLFRPYQFKPVLKLLNAGSQRLLIADEVGLGKTIEAGLLWTELEARRQADRVLVVCPSSLVAKWQREMEERFGFELVELTQPLLADLLDRLESDRAPRRAAYVCSIERLRSWSGLQLATDLGLQFDLAIVDEAHAFRNSDTKSHDLGEYISQWADALAMLSATPVNLRNRDLFNVLELLVPGEFGDLEALESRIEPNRVLFRIAESLFDHAVMNADRRSWLQDLRSMPFGVALMNRPDYTLLVDALSSEELSAEDIVRIKRLCSELHGLSAEITRTRKVEVQEDKALREPRTVHVDWSHPEHDFYSAFHHWCVERAAVKAMPLHFCMQMPLRLAGSCLPEAASSVLTWGDGFQLGVEDGRVDGKITSTPDVAPSRELMDLARHVGHDTKLAKFREALDDLVAQGKQTIVFTFSRRTLGYLQRTLGSDIRVAVLHGAVPRHKRDRIMADFRKGDYDVLLATKVASEGLDFEFCAAVVNYDLPWNPMEVEQRIGRIDRIGQKEEKIVVVNFHTPGTIETDIIERVMARIGVFEHAIGALEPILESRWKDIEATAFDFSLDAKQRSLRLEEAMAAIEEQAQALGDVETAAPLLVSSDGVDIDGLENELLASGRYVGQMELALLVEDWAETFGGGAEISDGVVRVRGGEQMANHVQALVRTGERRNSEVADLVADLRGEQPVVLALDQELSRVTGLSLLTATHPLTRAAVSTPGYKQGRFTSLRMSATDVEVPPGSYLVLLAVASWDGLRPVREVWASTVDLNTLQDPGPRLGDAVLRRLAQASLEAAPTLEHSMLDQAVSFATTNLELRAARRGTELERENQAFLATRRLSFKEVHDRRRASIEAVIAKHVAKGNRRMVPVTTGKLRKEEVRYAAQVAGLDAADSPHLSTSDLAVCVIEVGP